MRPRDAVETAGSVDRDSVMPIQLSTDQRVVGSEVLAREVDAAVGGSLGRLAERITRVEVHLTEGGAAASARVKIGAVTKCSRSRDPMHACSKAIAMHWTKWTWPAASRRSRKRSWTRRSPRPRTVTARGGPGGRVGRRADPAGEAGVGRSRACARQPVFRTLPALACTGVRLDGGIDSSVARVIIIKIQTFERIDAICCRKRHPCHPGGYR